MNADQHLTLVNLFITIVSAIMALVASIIILKEETLILFSQRLVFFLLRLSAIFFIDLTCLLTVRDIFGFSRLQNPIFALVIIPVELALYLVFRWYLLGSWGIVNEKSNR